MSGHCQKRSITDRQIVMERELDILNSQIEKILSRMEESAETMEVNRRRKLLPDDECVVCLTAAATMQTSPCGHQVVCRRCLIKTIQTAVSRRCLPLRCVLCRNPIVSLQHSVQYQASSSPTCGSTALTTSRLSLSTINQTTGAARIDTPPSRLLTSYQTSKLANPFKSCPSSSTLTSPYNLCPGSSTLTDLNKLCPGSSTSTDPHNSSTRSSTQTEPHRSCPSSSTLKKPHNPYHSSSKLTNLNKSCPKSFTSTNPHKSCPSSFKMTNLHKSCFNLSKMTNLHKSCPRSFTSVSLHKSRPSSSTLTNSHRLYFSPSTPVYSLRSYQTPVILTRPVSPCSSGFPVTSSVTSFPSGVTPTITVTSCPSGIPPTSSVTSCPSGIPLTSSVTTCPIGIPPTGSVTSCSNGIPPTGSVTPGPSGIPPKSHTELFASIIGHRRTHSLIREQTSLSGLPLFTSSLRLSRREAEMTHLSHLSMTEENAVSIRQSLIGEPLNTIKLCENIVVTSGGHIPCTSQHQEEQNLHTHSAKTASKQRATIVHNPKVIIMTRKNGVSTYQVSCPHKEQHTTCSWRTSDPSQYGLKYSQAVKIHPELVCRNNSFLEDQKTTCPSPPLQLSRSPARKSLGDVLARFLPKSS